MAILIENIIWPLHLKPSFVIIEKLLFAILKNNPNLRFDGKTRFCSFRGKPCLSSFDEINSILRFWQEKTQLCSFGGFDKKIRFYNFGIKLNFTVYVEKLDCDFDGKNQFSNFACLVEKLILCGFVLKSQFYSFDGKTRFVLLAEKLSFVFWRELNFVVLVENALWEFDGKLCFYSFSKKTKICGTLKYNFAVLVGKCAFAVLTKNCNFFYFGGKTQSCNFAVLTENKVLRF